MVGWQRWLAWRRSLLLWSLPYSEGAVKWKSTKAHVIALGSTISQSYSLSSCLKHRWDGWSSCSHFWLWGWLWRYKQLTKDAGIKTLEKAWILWSFNNGYELPSFRLILQEKKEISISLSNHCYFRSLLLAYQPEKNFKRMQLPSAFPLVSIYQMEPVMIVFMIVVMTRWTWSTCNQPKLWCCFSQLRTCGLTLGTYI